MNVADVMDELAQAVEAVPSLQGRSFPHPVGDIVPPMAIVPFPLADFDVMMARGSDNLPMTVVVFVRAVHDRATRDQLVAYIDGDGPESVKAAIEDHTYSALHSVRVERGRVQEYTVADAKYMAAVFDLDVIGPGTTS